MKTNFTGLSVERLKPPATGQVDIYDQGMPGLVLRVSASGRKTWCVMYRHRDGRNRRLTLGVYPIIALSEARKLGREKLRDASLGADPASDKQRERLAATFSDLAQLYLEKWARPRKRSAHDDERMLNHDVLPSWRNRQVEDIKRVDVRALLEGIAEHAPIQANRTAQLLSKIFNFAIDRELIESNPAYRMLTPGGPERVRDRVLNPDELKAVWRALDQEPAKERDLFLLAILLAARKSEVGDMAWPELDLDLGWWVIPAARVKNGKEHRLPVVGEALTILRRLRAAAPADAIQVFCGERNGKPIATVQKAIERIKTRTRIINFRFHDLRRTAASEMASSGIDPVTIGRLLNHIQRGITAKHYLRYSFDAEKRGALLRWDARVREIVTGESRPKVINIGTPAS